MIPNLFSKYPLPNTIPKEMQQIINQLKKIKNKKKCLKTSYGITTQRFHGQRIKAYTKAYQIFEININKLWNHTFLHCHHINYILRTLLIRSGNFNESNIIQKFNLIWFFSPHQYLIVDGTEVDSWARNIGVPYGKHLSGFH